MKLTIATLALLCALPSAALAYTDVDGSVAKLSELDRKLLEATLSYQLLDAASAQVRDFRLGTQSKGCGLVNAKTAGGGYGGFRPFAVELAEGRLRTARLPGGAISLSEFTGPKDPICEQLGF